MVSPACGGKRPNNDAGRPLVAATRRRELFSSYNPTLRHSGRCVGPWGRRPPRAPAAISGLRCQTCRAHGISGSVPPKRARQPLTTRPETGPYGTGVRQRASKRASQPHETVAPERWPLRDRRPAACVQGSVTSAQRASTRPSTQRTSAPTGPPGQGPLGQSSYARSPPFLEAYSSAESSGPSDSAATLNNQPAP